MRKVNDLCVVSAESLSSLGGPLAKSRAVVFCFPEFYFLYPNLLETFCPTLSSRGLLLCDLVIVARKPEVS